MAGPLRGGAPDGRGGRAGRDPPPRRDLRPRRPRPDRAALAGLPRGRPPGDPQSRWVVFGHVEDTARAHLQAFERGGPGEEYIVAGEPVTDVEVLDLAGTLTGLSAPRAVPTAVFRALSVLARGVDAVWTPPMDYRAEGLRVLGGVTYWGDNAKATPELGLEYRPLEAGLAETPAHDRDRLGV